MPTENFVKTEKYLADGGMDDDGRLHVVFSKGNPSLILTDEDIAEIKANFKDWGKWKKFKELKKDLEED